MSDDADHVNDATPPSAAETEPPPDTNGAASAAAREPPEPRVEPSPEIKPYLYYLERLVAVQLKNPYAIIDVKGLVKMMDNENNVRLEGMPGPVTDEAGGLRPQGIVVGALTVSPCGTALGLLINSPDTGAVLRMVLLPKDIAYMTVVARVPQQQPEPGRIVMPGAN
jgi:hypothetical protein